MENGKNKLSEAKEQLFEALLKEDNSCGVCASDFSGFVPESNLEKKVEGESSVC